MTGYIGVERGHGQRRAPPQEKVPQILKDHYPSHVPSVPGSPTRTISIIPNPYATRGIPEHPRIRAQLKAAIEGDEGAHAGMIKFRIRMHDAQPTSAPARESYLHRQALSRARGSKESNHSVAFLPPNFGRNLRLDLTDSRLMKFCASQKIHNPRLCKTNVSR